MFKKSFSTLNFYSRRLLSISQPPGIDWAKQDKVLMEPFEYIHKLDSKYHALMAPCFDHWLQVPKQKFDAIQEAMHTCMTWSMLLDDLQDDSNYRFGLPSAHRVFGVGLTVNAANNAMLISQKQVADLGNPSAVEKFWKVHEQFFYGAGVDFYWKEKNIFPSEQAHIEMTTKVGHNHVMAGSGRVVHDRLLPQLHKENVTPTESGSWFALPVELMQLFSTNKTDYKDLAVDVGTYYALVDDYYNLFVPNALQTLTTAVKRENYAPANDITESKMTLAIIHASQFPDVGPELAHILKQRTSDLNVVNRALSLIKKHGSDEYARNVLKKIDAEIRVEIDRLGGNPKLVAFLDGLGIY